MFKSPSECCKRDRQTETESKINKTVLQTFSYSPQPQSFFLYYPGIINERPT